MTLRHRQGDQELPQAGSIAVAPLVVRDLRESYSDVEGICADIEARIELGIQRYGHPLEAFNGRDAARDAYEELLDAANYLKQVQVEGGPSAPFHAVLRIAVDLQHYMELRGG